MSENKITNEQEIQLEFKRNLIGKETFASTTFSTVGHTRELQEMTIDMTSLRRIAGITGQNIH